MKRILLSSVGLVLAVAACAMGAPVYTAEPFSAQVVDAETGQPVAGAVIVANWELVSGGLDGPRHLGQLEVKETVTDERGQFSFPGFTRPNPALGELRGSDPRVLVFKGGYEAATYHGSLDPRNQGGARRRASIDGKVLKLARLKPTMTGPKFDVMQFHGLLNTQLFRIVGDCQWQKAPRLFLAMDEEKARLRSMHPGAIADIGIEDFSRQSPADCKLTRESVRGYLK